MKYIVYTKFLKVCDVVMPKQISAPFFSKNSVFRREDYAAAVGRRTGDKTVTAMLTQHLRAGNIKRIGRGVFASVPKHADARTWVVDRFVAASRLRRNGIIAYHSALELHGYAYTAWHEVQVIAEGTSKVVETAGVTCRFVSVPKGLDWPGGAWNDGIMMVDRLGQGVAVTKIELTIVHLFDRYDLAGGAEELFNSLELVERVDASALVRHASSCGNAAAIGALGFWMERERVRLGIPEQALENLMSSVPSEPRYALGAKPRKGKLAKGWNVILPIDVVEPSFEGI